MKYINFNIIHTNFIVGVLSLNLDNPSNTKASGDVLIENANFTITL